MVLSALRHLLWFRKCEKLDADSLRKIQEEKLQELFKAAKTTKAYSHLDFESLESLPFTEKRALRDNPESFVVAGKDPATLQYRQTSGSTGIPTKVYVDAEDAAYREAYRYFADMSAGRSPYRTFVHIYPMNFKPKLLFRLSGLFPKTYLPVHDSEEKNLAGLLRAKPHTVRTYPSTMFFLAQLNNASGNRLSFQNAVCDSEYLDDETRKSIEESFSCRAMNQYGSMEIAYAARECPEERKMHVDTFAHAFELVGDNGKPVKSGEGEIVITPLLNRTTPLIRYRIGDRAEWGGECSCGRQTPTLKRIVGRTDDLVVLPSGKVRPGMAFHPGGKFTEFLSMQIVQEEPDLFAVKYVPIGKDIPDHVKEHVRGRIEHASLGEKVRVEFEPVKSIKKGRTGKIRVVVSKVRPGSV